MNCIVGLKLLPCFVGSVGSVAFVEWRTNYAMQCRLTPLKTWRKDGDPPLASKGEPTVKEGIRRKKVQRRLRVAWFERGVGFDSLGDLGCCNESEMFKVLSAPKGFKVVA